MPIPPVTQPGGSSSTMSEGPLRVGLIPKKVTYPFEVAEFYTLQTRQLRRSQPTKGMSRIHVRFRQKSFQAFPISIR